MSLLDALRTAVRAIGANRMRSGLTALGLVIGVSSVIVLVAVGQGTQKGVTDRIRGLGTNLLFVRPATAASTGAAPTATESRITTADAQAIAESGIAGISAVAPRANATAQVIAGSKNLSATLVLTTADYAVVRNASVASGSFFTSDMQDSGELVAVLGATVAQQLFGDTDPTGQPVRISLANGRVTVEFTVVGVLKAQGGSSEADTEVMVPLAAVTSRFRFLAGPTGETPVAQIDVRTLPGVDQTALKQQISDLLLFTHNATEPSWVVQSQDDLISAATEVSTTLSILLGGVAGISLLVGGIGVMNIMLVSVTERTREIGIRRAVGALRRDVMLQFVGESLALSLVGALLGAAVGLSVSYGLDGRTVGGQQMITLVQPWSIALAFAVAAVVGFASGSYPAYRAAEVDPIAALRSE